MPAMGKRSWRVWVAPPGWEGKPESGEGTLVEAEYAFEAIRVGAIALHTRPCWCRAVPETPLFPPVDLSPRATVDPSSLLAGLDSGENGLRGNTVVYLQAG